MTDALDTLRDSYALHLDATRAPSTRRIYLAALDGLRHYLAANGMPDRARAIRREHIEAYIASLRAAIKPTSQSVEYRALQQFWKWALDEEEIDRSPMERMQPPRVPDVPVPVVSEDDFRRLLKSAEGREFSDRRDTAPLLMFDTGIRRSEAAGLKLSDVELRERLAYVTGKGGHMRAVRFGTRTASPSTDTCGSVAAPGTRPRTRCGSARTARSRPPGWRRYSPAAVAPPGLEAACLRAAAPDCRRSPWSSEVENHYARPRQSPRYAGTIGRLGHK